MIKRYKLFFIVFIVIFTMPFMGACGGVEDNSQAGQEQAEQEQNEDISGETPTEVSYMYVTINGNKLKVDLEDNSSVTALVEILKQGDITYTADDYGNFEKVGDIGYTLPQNNTSVTTQPGDVILYLGSNICLYYGVNTWSFTKIGHISGYSEGSLRQLLAAGSGSVEVTLSLD